MPLARLITHRSFPFPWSSRYTHATKEDGSCPAVPLQTLAPHRGRQCERACMQPTEPCACTRGRPTMTRQRRRSFFFIEACISVVYGVQRYRGWGGRPTFATRSVADHVLCDKAGHIGSRFLIDECLYIVMICSRFLAKQKQIVKNT